MFIRAALWLAALLLIGSVYTVRADEVTDNDPFAERREAAYELVESENEDQAFIIFQELASKGDFASQWEMADMLLMGRGVEKDEQRAREVLHKLAEADYPFALNLLGIIYRQGIGVDPNPELEFQYFERAAILGDLSAVANLAIMYYQGLEPVQVDRARARELYNRCADTLPVCDYRLGLMAWHGEGEPKNHEKGIRLIEKAATHGDRDAQYFMGQFLKWDENPDSDQKKAHEWWLRAANAGHAGAQWRVGMAYIRGEVVERDSSEAVKWFKSSAAQGEPDGLVSLGTMYATGDGIETDYKKAKELYEKAAALGVGEAYANLAVMYEKGEGIPVDLWEAAVHSAMGELLGSDTAKYFNKLYRPQFSKHDWSRIVEEAQVRLGPIQK